MSSEARVLPQASKKTEEKSYWAQLVEHAEIIAAVICGLLIVLGWIFEHANEHTLSVASYITAFLIGGFAKAKEGIEETIENKDLNVEMLMVFAAIGSGIIGYWAEGAILIFIFAVSGALETYTMNKSHREISSLMELQPEVAWLIVNGKEELVNVSVLQVGDEILVKPGERIPTDGEIVIGSTSIDEAAITGESMPVSKQLNDNVFAGTMNLRGSITVKITKPTSETLFQKIIQLVQNAQSEKSPSQAFIENFEGRYVKGVLLAVLIMMFLPHYLLDWSWKDTFYRAMILLVVASPCALVASIMPATLSAISNGAKHGILFKGGIHLERLSTLKVIAFDKTGTLTKGKPAVTNFYVRSDYHQSELQSIVAGIESHSTHPLAVAIVQFVKDKGIELKKPDSIEDLPGFGVKGIVNGMEYSIGKAEFVGVELAMNFLGGIANGLANEGKTIVYIADAKGIVGIIALKDVVREDAASAIAELKQLGIQTVMLTGDSQATATIIAAESGIDHFEAECLPEEKVNYLHKLKAQHDTVAMVGDGINDAPALATAHIGIAMGEGTDVALETADVVLMKNDLKRLADAVKLSRKMNRIVKQNIIFSLTVIALLICSNFLQAIDLPFGVIGHEGSTILVILNGLRLLRN